LLYWVFRPFCLQPSARRPGIARLPADLRPLRQASPLARRLARPRRPNRVHDGSPLRNLRYGLVVLVTLLSTSHYCDAVTLQYPTTLHRRRADFHRSDPALSQAHERGRSPPAARRSVEVAWSIPEPFHQLCCCGPGRSAARRWRFQNAPFRCRNSSQDLFSNILQSIVVCRFRTSRLCWTDMRSPPGPKLEAPGGVGDWLRIGRVSRPNQNFPVHVAISRARSTLKSLSVE